MTYEEANRIASEEARRIARERPQWTDAEIRGEVAARISFALAVEAVKGEAPDLASLPLNGKPNPLAAKIV